MKVIEYEMGYQSDEFGKVLNGPFSGEKSVYECTLVSPLHWRISRHNQPFQIEIKIMVMPKRKLGPLIEMPVLKVTFHLANEEDQFSEDFFTRFFKYFHKGGG